MQPSYIKSRAIRLRNLGYSYNLIGNKLGLSKSTLSDWLRDIPFRPNKIVKYRIQYGPLKSAEKRHNKKVESVLMARTQAKQEIGVLSPRDIWMLGLGIYLGEGSKLYETIRIINSDPDIMGFSIRWLKEVCGLKNENITIAIHLYPDNNISQTLKFWSRVLHIPMGQFRKTQIDNRLGKSGKKARKLPYGTAHLTVVSNGDPRFGVLLHRRIIGWLEAVRESV